MTDLSAGQHGGQGASSFGQAARPGVAEVGLTDVTEVPVVVDCEYPSFADYWATFTDGQGIVSRHLLALSDDVRGAIQRHARAGYLAGRPSAPRAAARRGGAGSTRPRPRRSAALIAAARPAVHRKSSRRTGRPPSAVSRRTFLHVNVAVQAGNRPAADPNCSLAVARDVDSPGASQRRALTCHIRCPRAATREQPLGQ